MPGLIEQRGRQILGRLETLVEFFRRNDLVEQGLRDRLAGLIMLGVILQHLRPIPPHLVDLRRILHEVARDTSAAEARILYVRKHSMQRVTEFVKRSPCFIGRQQSRLTFRRLGDVEMIRDDRLRA